jgi:hypothetical protein
MPIPHEKPYPNGSRLTFTQLSFKRARELYTQLLQKGGIQIITDVRNRF